MAANTETMLLSDTAHRKAGAVDLPAVVTTATLRAAAILAVNDRQLAQLLGKDRSAISRYRSGKATLDPESLSGQMAAYFIRMYRSLAAQFGEDDRVLQQWLHGPVGTLAAKPIDLLATPQGLIHVLDYLDDLRGR